MTFFDENMQAHDVTMQELQLAAQEMHNHELASQEPPQSNIWYEMQADACDPAWLE